ncbi:unannotated protein [freshwater metagenome]|uniref:Unannotated protein n=1 Tax=freshwater metagenome TaxID=449393 RepID=A0A6J7AL25_9ZZZZ|nr:hypothetical protein [Actinomycetota bacterium]MSX49021.1 hypothetical protein [Actinomycetota bacterium]MSX62984.1 hypothetical protein [Actinomycetota bacterium]TRZ87409.1 MAG: hypothetical protein D4R83_02420 [Streptomycetaceae bacterium]
MRFGFTFFWAVLVSTFMIFTTRKKVLEDKNLTSVNWDLYKLKLSQTWWTGFLAASMLLTIFYLLVTFGITK